MFNSMFTDVGFSHDLAFWINRQLDTVGCADCAAAGGPSALDDSAVARQPLLGGLGAAMTLSAIAKREWYPATSPARISPCALVHYCLTD